MTPEETFRAGFDLAKETTQADSPREMVSTSLEERQISPESRRRFTGGLKKVELPDVALLPVATNPRSSWYRRRCAECRHTFRVGDPAATCPRCSRVYHWNPIHGLDCLGVVFDHEEGHCICRAEEIQEPPPWPDLLASPEQMSAFVGGLADEWSAFDGREPTVVTEELEGRLCSVCGHTVRLREMVVRCPCGNGPGNVCSAVIHLDFARQLHCWNDWHGGRGKSYCPLTGHEYHMVEVSR